MDHPRPIIRAPVASPFLKQNPLPVPKTRFDFGSDKTKIPDMKVALTRHFDRYLTEKMASGRYASPSEVIQEALRQMEEREQRDEPASLQAKISAGFKTPLRRVTASGWPSKWARGIALANKLRTERRRAA